MPEGGSLPEGAAWRPVGIGWREPGGSWVSRPFAEGEGVSVEALADGAVKIDVHRPGAAGVELAFAVPPGFQAFGGGERFEALDLRGHSVRYYLENFGLGSGTYLPSPWISTSLGYALWLGDEAPAVFHVAPSFDPERLRVQVEGPRMAAEIHLGDLPALHAQLIRRIGPPLMPDDAFFGVWKAGDWRYENAATVAADQAGFAALGVPMRVKLLDAYWAAEVHSFAFDTVKYPDAAGMLERLAAAGTEVHLWLCPWVVVGTRSHAEASARGFVIVDGEGRPITRRPGANPNVVAALIDFSNPDAADWWSGNLRGLLARGIAGFKVDFGEQLPEHAVLASGETGGRAHNAFVRHYLQATIDAFDGRTPAIISRSGSPAVRAPIWTGDQTSDFCPKAGLPAAIRAVQSAALCGWSFVGSDLGGYFGTPTPQVFARWSQFACFTPLMMLHGLGCREPWGMGAESAAIFRRYALLHLALRPVFLEHGRTAAAGGRPLLRMMPLAFPETDWRGINDWDQQFMLGDDILVAPVAFYGNTRAVYLPPGDWFDVLAGSWATGPGWRVHDVPLDRITLFVRSGSRLLLAPFPGEGRAVALVFAPDDRTVPARPGTEETSGAWAVEAVGRIGGASGGGTTIDPAMAEAVADWFGPGIVWSPGPEGEPRGRASPPVPR